MTFHHRTHATKEIDGCTVTVRKGVVRIDPSAVPKKKTVREIYAAMSPEQLAGVRKIEAGFTAHRLRKRADDLLKRAAEELRWRGVEGYDPELAPRLCREAAHLQVRADKMTGRA
jgi:hypothetical protein